ALALINILIFHARIQRTQAQWDAAPAPPGPVRAAAALSIAAWVLVITLGRLIAYDWFECGKPQPDFINWAESCAASEHGAARLGASS
ncbi:MAG: hypothetical protein JWO33_1284, partial [Caulobacteraceae bacterium]|nr:hypothetical protein [Caulobacteraceae bacterium]